MEGIVLTLDMCTLQEIRNYLFHLCIFAIILSKASQMDLYTMVEEEKEELSTRTPPPSIIFPALDLLRLMQIYHLFC